MPMTIEVDCSERCPVRTFPSRTEPVVVLQLVVQIDLVAEVRVCLSDRPLHRKSFESEPRGDPHGRADEQEQVREVAEELHAARDGGDEEPDPEDREVPGPHDYAR